MGSGHFGTNGTNDVIQIWGEARGGLCSQGQCQHQSVSLRATVPRLCPWQPQWAARTAQPVPPTPVTQTTGHHSACLVGGSGPTYKTKTKIQIADLSSQGKEKRASGDVSLSSLRQPNHCPGCETIPGSWDHSCPQQLLLTWRVCPTTSRDGQNNPSPHPISPFHTF